MCFATILDLAARVSTFRLRFARRCSKYDTDAQDAEHHLDVQDCDISLYNHRNHRFERFCITKLTFASGRILDYISLRPEHVVHMVSFHNFKSQNFKLSVSNPISKYVAYLSIMSNISNCQGPGRKNKHENLKTDRIAYSLYYSSIMLYYNTGIYACVYSFVVYYTVYLCMLYSRHCILASILCIL